MHKKETTLIKFYYFVHDGLLLGLLDGTIGMLGDVVGESVCAVVGICDCNFSPGRIG